MSFNPVIKNEPFKFGIISQTPSVPENAALVLYPHGSREHCNVYLFDDIVYGSEIRKWHFDRLAHISLNPFKFVYMISFPFSDGINQYEEITYNFVVSIKPDKESIKKIIIDNITDISEPITSLLNIYGQVHLDREYSCLEYQALEISALNKIKDLLSTISYLKISVEQISVKRDIVSDKQIEKQIENELENVRVNALKYEFDLKEREAEINRREAEIARIKAENELAIMKLENEKAKSAQDFEIEKKIRELEAEKEYDNKKAEKIHNMVKIDRKLLEEFSIEELGANDPRFEKLAELQQGKIDRDRDNFAKNLDLAIRITDSIQKSGINDLAAEKLLNNLFTNVINNYQLSSGLTSSDSEQYDVLGNIEEQLNIPYGDSIEISEDGKEDIN